MAYDIGTARGVIEMTYNGRGIAQATGDLTRLEATGNKAAKGLGIASKAVFGIGLTVAATLAYAVKSTADFEQGIDAIGAVSGASAQELDALRDKALQLGQDTAFSATEAASAMEELVKAGLSVDEVLNGAADAAVALAAAGGIDIPEAATLAANAMNQFNLEASDMMGVVDSIAGAANASAIDVGQFGQSLKQVGAVANLAGMTFDDVAVAIALLGNAGIVGSDAGTSLKTMFQNLQPITKKQKDLFEELGIVTEDGANRFFDAEGNVKSYAGVANVLSDALAGMTNQQKLMALETMFGTDAIRAAAITADAGAKGVREMDAAMDEFTAAEVAAKRMDNFKGSLDQLGGSIETALILGGSDALVILRAIVDGMTEGINSATDLGGELAGRLGPGFGDLVDAGEDVVRIAMAIIDVFDGIIGAVAKLGLGALIALFTGVAGVIEGVTSALEGQEAIILIVAGAWLLMANGGLATVIARLGYLAAYAVVQAISGLIALQGAAVATSAQLATLAASAASAALSLGVVAGLVLAVMAWQAYTAAVQETDDALQSVEETKKRGDFNGFQKEIDALKDMMAERQKVIDEFGGANSWNPSDMWDTAGQIINPANWNEIFAVKEYKDAQGELSASSQELLATLGIMVQSVVDLGEEFSMIDSDEATALFEAFNSGDPAALEKINALVADMAPLLEAAGYTTDQFMAALRGEGPTTVAEIADDMRLVADAGLDATTGTKSLTEAAKDFANEAMSAATAAKQLDEALDALIGVELGAAEAGIRWREGLRKIREEIDRTGGSLFANTKVGDANKQLVIDQTDALLARISAEGKAGTSIDKLTAMFGNSRREMINTIGTTKAQRKEVAALLNQYGFTPEVVRTLIEQIGMERAQKQIDRLTTKYNLTPEVKKTIFEAAGATTATEKVKALQAYIRNLKGANPEIRTPGAEDSEKQIKDLRAQIKELKPKAADISTPGAREAAAEIQRLRDQIAALRDKSITITTYKRTIGTGVGPGYAGDEAMGGGGGGGGGGTGDAGRIGAGYLPTDTGSPSLPPVGTFPAGRPRGGSGVKPVLRVLDGELRLDASGRAFISGVAEDEVDADDDYDDTLIRMGRQ